MNNIYFWPYLILPRQSIPSFQEWIKEALKGYPYTVHYTNSEFVHTLLGGIHCASQVAYSCRPR